MEYLGHSYTKELFTVNQNSNLVVNYLQAGGRVGEIRSPTPGSSLPLNFNPNYPGLFLAWMVPAVTMDQV